MGSLPVSVFVVESCAIAQQQLTQFLTAAADIQVVGTAQNGMVALQQIPQLQPDVICTNLRLPKLNGLELIRQLMAVFPKPILVISSSVHSTDSETIAEVLSAGAVDIYPQPITGRWSIAEQQALIAKLKVLSGVKVFTKKLRPPVSTPAQLPPIIVSGETQVLAIGASTGGPQAIHQILRQLPANFPLPIFCTQHISVGFLEGLVNWQASKCSLRVKIAEQGETPVPGTVYFAPDRHHLVLDSRGRCHYSLAPAVNRHCPSVTVMFESLAQYYGAGVLGVLLTGMGQDGAVGLKAISQAGGLTIAQDEASSIVFGMPKVAIDLGAAQRVLPVEEMGAFILKQLNAHLQFA